MMILVIGPSTKRPVETQGCASRYYATTKKGAPLCVSTAPMSQTP